MAHVQRTVQVNGDDLVPELGRGVDEVDELIPASVVDQDVGRSGHLLELGDAGAHRLVVGDVDARGEPLDLAATLLAPSRFLSNTPQSRRTRRSGGRSRRRSRPRRR
jgi:hypothetical protein